MKKIFYIVYESLPAGRQGFTPALLRAKRGFTIFFAMLVGSLSLAIGLAVYDLTIRELDLSATATQSQYAIYAADAGAECVLYWDSNYLGTGSAFPTSTQSAVPASGVTCVGQDIAAHGAVPTPFSADTSTWAAWNTSQITASAATTTFTLMLGASGNSACAMVDVAKAVISGAVYTTVTSRGFNACSADISPRVERRFEVRY